MKSTALVLSFALTQVAFNSSAQEPKTAQEAPASVAAMSALPLASLQKIDTLVGTGTEAVAGKNVVVHYSGWLHDAQAVDQHGKAFDSSVGRGPFNFSLGARQVIPGWDQGVAGMKVGGKRTLIIPSHMGYGARGAGGGVIPPNADLIFDVELLDVLTPPEVEKIETAPGKGEACSPGEKVTVHYTGWLRDPKAKKQRGKEFDSSRKRAPLEFNLGAGQVIRGWDQGVAGMKVGGKRTLIIPSALGYGAHGIGNGLIPPNADLIFEVELIKISK